MDGGVVEVLDFEVKEVEDLLDVGVELEEVGKEVGLREFFVHHMIIITLQLHVHKVSHLTQMLVNHFDRVEVLLVQGVLEQFGLGGKGLLVGDEIEDEFEIEEEDEYLGDELGDACLRFPQK